jgi:hypothetical protein
MGVIWDVIYKHLLLSVIMLIVIMLSIVEPRPEPIQVMPPDLTYKHKTRLEGLARDKHYSLLVTFVKYGQKSFTTLAPSAFFTDSGAK